MRKYLRFLDADQVGGLRHGGRYGDWLALEAPTGLELIGTAYLARSAALFAGIARLLGHDEDADDVRSARGPSARGLPPSVRDGAAARPRRPRRATPSRSGSTSCRAATVGRRGPPREPDPGGRRPSPDRVPGHGARPGGPVRPRTPRAGHAARPPGHVSRLGLRGPPGRDDDLGALERLDAGARVRRPVDELAQPRGLRHRRRLAARAPGRACAPGRPAIGRCWSAPDRQQVSSLRKRRTSRRTASTRSSGLPSEKRLEITSRCRPTRSPMSSFRAQGAR